MHRYAVKHLKQKSVMKNISQQTIHNAVHRLSGYAASEIAKHIRRGRHHEAEALAVLVDNLGQVAAQNSPFGAAALEAAITNHTDLHHSHHPVQEGDVDFRALWQELLKSPNGELRQ